MKPELTLKQKKTHLEVNGYDMKGANKNRIKTCYESCINKERLKNKIIFKFFLFIAVFLTTAYLILMVLYYYNNWRVTT